MSGLDQVRAVLDGPQDVDLPDDLAALRDGGREAGDPGSEDRGPEDRPDDDIEAAFYQAAPPGGDVPPEPTEGGSAAFATLPLNDIGNGRRFAGHFGQDLMWVPRVGWFTWTGQVWAKDPDGLAVRAKAQKVSALIIQEAAHLAPPPEQAARMSDDEISKWRTQRIGQHLRHAKNAGNSGPIDSMMKEASVGLAVQLEALDLEALDVNTESGVLRFSVDRGGNGVPVARVDLLAHDRALRMTKIMPVRYRPDAACPRFDEFLRRIQPDPLMRGFLKRWFGLAMTGLTIQKLAFLYGTGANGKSVLVDLIARVLGDYAASAKIESLTGTNRRGGGDATPDLVPMIGARFLRTSEPDEGMRWQEGLIKELTGGEPILVRALHSDFVEVRPKFNLTISGNHKPEIRGTDDGIWRRLLLVPFEEKIPKAEQTPKDELDAILFAERDGVFAWMVEGLLDYLELGLQEPGKVLEATSEFREESDPLGAFLTICCLVTGDAGDRISAKDLVEGFNYWRASDGAGEWQPNTVAKRLKGDKADKWRHPATGRSFTSQKVSSTWYVGIRFTDMFKHAMSMAVRDPKTGRLQGRPIDESAQ